MTAEQYSTYDEAAAAYLTRLRALRDAAGTAPGPFARRGAAGMPGETLVEQAGEIADVSASLVTLAKPYVESTDPATRQGISAQLLAQAAAELQLATELLQLTPGEDTEPAPFAATRAADGMQLRQAISAVESVMAQPVGQAFAFAAGPVRAATRPETPEAAREALEKSASTATTAITQRTVELGSTIVLDLTLRTEWTAVVTGASLLREDVAEKLETIRAGVSAVVQRIVNAAAATLLNVYDKILLLLGKDVEDTARQKIQEWLEQLKGEDGAERQERLLASLLERFYNVDGFREELKGWLSQTAAGVETVNDTTAQVDRVGGQYATFTGHLGALQTAATLARMVKIPQVLTVIAAIEVALLAVVVYAGLDYIGYRAPRFPNMAKGVAEIVRAGLLL
jgi:hypothetical protein